MILKSHCYPSNQNYAFTSNKSYFNTKFSKVNDVVFDTKFSQVGAIAEIYEQDLIIYDGGSVEGWEDELPNEKNQSTF